MQFKLNTPLTVRPHVIVGGGLAGLTAAATLARAGQPVTLLERSRSLGGRAASQSRDGFTFNQGPHALYKDSLGLPILQELGVPLSGHNPNYNRILLLLNGQLHKLPAIFDFTLWSLPERWELLQTLSRLRKLAPADVQGQAVAAWAEQHVQRPRVRALIYTLIRVATYANAPALQAMDAAALQMRRANGAGVWYLDGGWQTLVDGLSSVATAAGAAIRTATGVSAITHGPSGPRVHLDDGTPLDAASVIVAVPPARARDLLVETDTAALNAWLPAGPAVRAAVLDVAMSRLPRPKHTFAVGVDQPLYYSLHSAAAHLAPAGGALVHLAKYLAADDADPTTAQAELTHFMDLLQPGWQAHVVHQRFLPNMVVAQAVDLPTGAGTSRALPTVPGYPGVYAAGDWVACDAMLADAAIAGGRQAAQLALQAAASEAPQLSPLPVRAPVGLQPVQVPARG